MEGSCQPRNQQNVSRVPFQSVLLELDQASNLRRKRRLWNPFTHQVRSPQNRLSEQLPNLSKKSQQVGRALPIEEGHSCRAARRGKKPNNWCDKHDRSICGAEVERIREVDLKVEEVRIGVPLSTGQVLQPCCDASPR